MAVRSETGHPAWKIWNWRSRSSGREPPSPATCGLAARFVVGDALTLGTLGEQFDTVLDCGLYHLLTAMTGSGSSRACGRPSGQGAATSCSASATPASVGPRWLTRDEIAASLADGWRVDAVQPASMDVVGMPRSRPY